MVGIVIVSHNHLLAVGLQEMALQMAHNRVKITTAGGVDNETTGTNAERIYQAIQDAYTPDGVLILFDLGSALLSTHIAIEMLTPEQQSRVSLCDAPIVEGAIAAAIEASLGHSLEEVTKAAKAAGSNQKFFDF
ncbi:MAG: PTS-dependent dihydroxyacetone kinase phosphotransferase subunit DhaM [Anaerolineae bacterium]|nr:PTS-dependent dihydroxyacetone kinase phosphotransferase subunit DhaM [Anaerolineae bacterium]